MSPRSDSPPDVSVDLDLDNLPTTTTYPPWKVRLGGAVYEVEEPDAGLVMEIESARQTQFILALIFDKHWPTIEQAVMRLAKEALVTLVRSYFQHFDLDEAGFIAKTAPNRAERRRERRGRG